MFLYEICLVKMVFRKCILKIFLGNILSDFFNIVNVFFILKVF